MSSAISPKPSAAGLVSTEIDNGIAVVCFDNPPVNALSRDLRAGLLQAITSLWIDDSVEAVVLVGANGSFIAGADLKEFGQPLTEPTLPAVLEAIEKCPKPVVAAIEGAALGGGYEIALACDGRVASASAVVGLPEGTFGIIPGAGGIERIVRLTDSIRALEIVSSCRRVKASEAKELGLVDAVVENLRQDAIAFARSIGGSKRRLRDQEPKSFDATAFDAAAQTTLRRGKGRPYVAEQIEAVRRASTEPFETALAESRSVFKRLRDSDESAALRHLFFAERQAAKLDGVEGVEPITVGSVGVVGAGTMGSGIAAAFLASGYPVTLTDLNVEALGAAHERIKGYLSKASRPAELTVAEDLEGLRDCDLVIEAVFEDMAVKKDLMARLDRVAKPGAILASNTSYLDLDAIAAATARPESVVGLHFFAPAHIMKLLEIVRGDRTAADVLQTSFALAKRLRKVAVVSRVGDGFIGNRIYNAYRSECEALLMEGATPETVDSAVEALGFAMGPFSVSDLSGLDIAWANRRRKQEATGDKGDVPVLEWLAAAGRLGRKTGAGWYRYADDKREPDAHVVGLVEQARAERNAQPRIVEQEELQMRALAAIVNEALLVLEDGIAARASDIDLVLINGYGFPKHMGGPLFWAARQNPVTLERNLVRSSRGGRVGKLELIS